MVIELKKIIKKSVCFFLIASLFLCTGGVKTPVERETLSAKSYFDSDGVFITAKEFFDRISKRLSGARHALGQSSFYTPKKWNFVFILLLSVMGCSAQQNLNEVETEQDPFFQLSDEEKINFIFHLLQDDQTRAEGLNLLNTFHEEIDVPYEQFSQIDWNGFSEKTFLLTHTYLFPPEYVVRALNRGSSLIIDDYGQRALSFIIQSIPGMDHAAQMSYLESIGEARFNSVPYLEEALDQSDERTKAWLLRALSNIDDPQVVPVLERFSTYEFDPRVRMAALFGLARRGRVTLNSEIPINLQSPETIPPDVIRSLANYPDNLVLLFEILNRNDLSLELQTEAMNAIENLDPFDEAYYDDLIYLMSHDNNQITLSAFNKIVAIGEPIIPRVVELFPRLSPGRAIRAVRALRLLEADSDEVRELYSNALGHEDPYIRKEALRGLYEIDPNYIDRVIDALRDRDIIVLREAFGLLADLGADIPREAFPNLQELLNRENGEVVSTAIRLLALYGIDAFEPLRDSLEESTANYQERVFQVFVLMDSRDESMIQFMARRYMTETNISIKNKISLYFNQQDDIFLLDLFFRFDKIVSPAINQYFQNNEASDPVFKRVLNELAESKYSFLDQAPRILEQLKNEISYRSYYVILDLLLHADRRKFREILNRTNVEALLVFKHVIRLDLGDFADEDRRNRFNSLMHYLNRIELEQDVREYFRYSGWNETVWDEFEEDMNRNRRGLFTALIFQLTSSERLKRETALRIFGRLIERGVLIDPRVHDLGITIEIDEDFIYARSRFRDLPFFEADNDAELFRAPRGRNFLNSFSDYLMESGIVPLLKWLAEGEGDLEAINSRLFQDESAARFLFYILVYDNPNWLRFGEAHQRKWSWLEQAFLNHPDFVVRVLEFELARQNALISSLYSGNQCYSFFNNIINRPGILPVILEGLQRWENDELKELIQIALVSAGDQFIRFLGSDNFEFDALDLITQRFVMRAVAETASDLDGDLKLQAVQFLIDQLGNDQLLQQGYQLLKNIDLPQAQEAVESVKDQVEALDKTAVFIEKRNGNVIMGVDIFQLFEGRQNKPGNKRENPKGNNKRKVNVLPPKKEVEIAI